MSTSSSTQNARTCIIATLGPATDSAAGITSLLDAGVNVFRLNFSHGDRAHHARVIETIRQQEKRHLRPIGILQDLQGPKIRVGKFGGEGNVQLETGGDFALLCDGHDGLGDADQVTVTYGGLSRDVNAGDRLLLDDGRLELEVVNVDNRTINTRVTRGGKLSSNKGINIPGSELNIPALSDKDVEDMKLGAELGVDWVAMSFVRSRDDVFLARHYMRRFESTARLMAKIEKPQAVARFGDILEASDGIMVARGDLGVELSPEKVPMIQKQLIRAAREAGKPVVTATQMLESMINAPLPTRAEASDVANAIFDGSDAVMLSAETAVGEYPTLAVKFMNRLAVQVETDMAYQKAMEEKVVHTEQTVADAVAHGACRMAAEVDAKVIVTYSSSGATALRVARHRTRHKVLAITPNETAYRQLSMSWGIDAVLAEDDIHSTDEMVLRANEWILKTGLAQPGDIFLITAGVPFGVTGTTNLIRVETVQAGR